MIAILISALAAQLLPEPSSVRWEMMVEESHGPSFVDPASITRDGDIVRFLNRTDRNVDDGSGVRMIVVRVAIDCRRRMIGMMQGDTYDGAGHLISSIDPPGDVQFQPLPESPGGIRVFQRMCGAPAR